MSLFTSKTKILEQEIQKLRKKNDTPYARFDKTVFLMEKKQVTNIHFGSGETTHHDCYTQISTSGKMVDLGDKILYECLVLQPPAYQSSYNYIAPAYQVQWLDKANLRFPK